MFLNILSLLYKLKNSKFLIQESYDCKLFSVSDNKCFKVIVDFLFFPTSGPSPKLGYSLI